MRGIVFNPQELIDTIKQHIVDKKGYETYCKQHEFLKINPS